MATYFISAIGNDTNDGLTPQTAWQTIGRSNLSVKCGDTVRLRCGDTFYGQIRAPKGNDNVNAPTVYTFYGEGVKPIVSQYKTARSDAWESIGNDVWRIDLTDTSKFDGNVTELDTNVGFIKANGAIKPWKRFELDKLEQEWDFYNDKQYVYVKSKENPALVAEDIKFACNIICMPFADNILVENIIFIGSGAHGISGTVNHATVRNCEFHELGGSELTTHFRPGVRYGNGLECWTDSSDVLVENCKFSNIYDVALTLQGNNVKRGWVNMTFRNNVIWNCQQGFEIWSGGELDDTGFKNCVFEKNICIDSGFSWGHEVRANKQCSSHLLIYQLECPICDVTVRNNTFYNARVSPIVKSGGLKELPSDYKIINNLFLIAPEQDIILRVPSTTDEEYNSFYDMIAGDNQIIKTDFYTSPKIV